MATEEPLTQRSVSRRPLGQSAVLGGMTTVGERATWVAGLALSISAFTDWYAGSGPVGPTIAVIGWHTGTLGKLVFFIGLAAIAWSRVYVGVHYPLDVLGGAALGILIAIALRWLSTVLRRSQRATPAG